MVARLRGTARNIGHRQSLGTRVLECRRNAYCGRHRQSRYDPGLEHMSNTNSHAKNRGKKLTATEKRDAKIAATRKARRQWYLIAGALLAVVVLAIVLIAFFTEGEIPVRTNTNG